MRFNRPMRLIPAFLATLLVGVLAPTVSASAAVPVCADLQVVSFTVDPATPIVGQQATIDVTVHNGGTCTAFGATLQWKLTPFAASGPSTQINSLAAGATQTFELPYTFLKAGNFESIARVDTKNVVSETNEKNNTQILPITVLAAGIDLSIKSITTTPDAPVASGYPNDPVQGRNETTTIVLHNGGNTAAGSFQLKWVPKPFAPALTYQVAGLPANSDSAPINLSYTYQQAGSFRSTATVDATRLVKETNERNNTATKTVKVDPQRADLIVSGVEISPTPIVPGALTTATITVKNQGNTTSNAFMLNWRPQPFSAPVSQQVGPLAPNASTPVQLQFTYARAGSFAGLIRADSTNVVKEINENNNTLATHVVVEPNTVDLQIVGETITGTQQRGEFGPAIAGGTVIGTPTQGQPVTVDIQVQNTGNTRSGPFLVDWNPDATYVISPSLQTVTKEVADLGPGETTDVVFTFTYPVYGNFSTLVTLDPRNQVTETNEANNQLITPITVAPAPIDLTVDLGVSPEPVVRGSQATATVTVTNNGDFPASKPFTVQWFPTGSGLPQSQVVQGLSPNESTTLTFTYTYSVIPQGGTYDSYAVVDSGNAIPETDEGNNTAHQAVTVVPQQTSLTVSVVNLHAFNSGDSGLRGSDGEWDPMIFGVFDPTATCSVLGQTIKDVRCVTNDNQDVSGGEDFNPGLSINLTLKEQTPLLAAVIVLEDDSGLFTVKQFMGFAPVISLNPQYKTLDTTVNGQQGDCDDSSPTCFNAHVVVSNVTSNVPAAMNMLSVQPTDDQVATMNNFETVVQQQAG